ncbi:T9SS type A sorting domain-containing protein [bacterium]|nr:MAG: T9SS type A sorting domain-containing protein [bacterium]
MSYYLKRICGAFILVLVLSHSLSAQFRLDGWRSALNERSNSKASSDVKLSNGNLHIVAAMVEFQPDENDYTTGDGTFNPSYLDSSIIVIDPLPHNQGYFEAHLEFVKNYFETASKNQLSVSYEVLPSVYQLDNEMAYYSPTGETNENDNKLTWLLRDTWEKVDLDPAVSTLNWTNNTLFILFHAGAGRDFDFLNTTLDRTPQDIPSIYLTQNRIADLMNDNSFDGFTVKGYKVTNTGILPETESRPGELFGERYVLQLGINGLLTAITGNHIGLPDLFNTVDGTSAIGRFGLMDPEGFFAYFGLFPPLPSAWERLYMGWDSPTEISFDSVNPISLSSVSLQPASGVLKYSISEEEYYLIENRHRDAVNTGITISIRKPDGTITTQTFSNTDTKFSATNLDSLVDVLTPGVIIATNNYDWALPGGLDVGNDGDYFTADDRLLNGGILIWHIDEAIINSGLISNTINSNVYRKGVDLEEADGAQDIGNSTNNLFLESVVGGTAYDFWWSGNNYTVISEEGDSLRAYQNRFAPDTRPSTVTNSGAYNPVEFYDISSNLPNATLSIRPFDGFVKLDARFSNRKVSHSVTQVNSESAYPLHAMFYMQGSDTLLIIPSKAGLTALHSDKNHSFSETKLATQVLRQPIIYQNQLIAVTGAQEVSSFSFNTNTGWQTNWITDVQSEVIGMISITNNKLDLERTQAYLDLATGGLEFDNLKPLITSATISGMYAELTQDGLVFNGVTHAVDGDVYLSNRLILGLVEFNNSLVPFIQADEKLFYFDEDIIALPSHGYMAGFKASNYSSPIFIQSDITTGDLIAQYSTGAFADNFPVSINNQEFIQTPLLVDWEGDGETEVLAVKKDSLYYQITIMDSKANELTGFPLIAGSINQFEGIQPVFSDKKLLTTTPDGSIYVWNLPEQAQVKLASPYGSLTDGKVLYSVESFNGIPNDELLVSSETYNWPNPARASTQLRWQTTASAEIKIDIYSISGRKVWSVTTQSNGNVPEEITLQTSRWGSGVYYVRVQAKSAQSTSLKTYKLVIEQ